MYKLKLSQQQMINFVMIDASNLEVAGLADTFTLQISKSGAAFVASTGTKTEIGSGWYAYTLTAAETNTVGPLSIKVTGAGCIQQNLWYVVESETIGGVWFTYTLTNLNDGTPISNADIRFSVDNSGQNIVWWGQTDVFGVARDYNSHLPLLDPGTYYVWRKHPGFMFNDPDTEVVS